MKMKNCVFCEIVKKEISAEIVFENKDILAFLDINPIRPGHLLVVPKKHFENLLETPEKTAVKVFIESKKLMATVKKVFKADYVTLSVVGKDVPHLHFHIIPRREKDSLPTEKLGAYRVGELQKIAKKIKSAHNLKKKPAL